MRLRNVALSSLRRRKARAAFLVAGLLIGVGTVVALLTLSQALTVQAQNNLETYGANIVVAPRDDGLSLTYGGVPLGGVFAGLMVPPLAPMVTPRLLSSDTLAVVARVPPLRVSWLATAVAGAVPKLLSAEMLSVPPLMVVVPV